jgi:hypothetical protein
VYLFFDARPTNTSSFSSWPPDVKHSHTTTVLEAGPSLNLQAICHDAAAFTDIAPFRPFSLVDDTMLIHCSRMYWRLQLSENG